MASSNQGSSKVENQGSKGGEQGGNQRGKSERGFAAMDPARQREIASEGGKAAHRSGNAHEFNSEEAREAGRKGGQASGGNLADKTTLTTHSMRPQGRLVRPFFASKNL